MKDCENMFFSSFRLLIYCISSFKTLGFFILSVGASSFSSQVPPQYSFVNFLAPSTELEICDEISGAVAIYKFIDSDVKSLNSFRS